MKQRTKLFSIGLLAILVSVLFINGFIQINLTNTGSNLGSNKENPTFGNADTQFTMIYGDPTQLTVQKTESVSIDLFPNGSVRSHRVTINFVMENEAYENCSFDLIDRSESCDLDTIKFQKGTFSEVPLYDIIATDEDFGINILKWSNLSVSARSKAEFGYVMTSYKPAPITVETEYWVNGSLIAIDPAKNEINASIGSFVSNIIRIRNIQQPLYSSYDSGKPTTLALLTLMIPYEEEEEDRDITEPIFSAAPILTTEILGIQQASWLVLGDEYELNWSTTVVKGGGWGIIELQPISISLIQASSITGGLFDALSGLLGIVAAQQAYWAALTLMAMIEELMGMMGIFEILLNDIQLMLGTFSMVSYSLINSLLISLVELDMAMTSLQEIYTQLSNMYTDIEAQFGYFDPITSEFRTILGILPEGVTSNGLIGLGIPYMSLPLLIDYYEDIERRIIASFGAQLIELLGSPAVINFTSTTDDFSLLINATATPLPDNSTDFYVFIDIANLSLPIALGYSLNLTASYEFQLDVPLDRLIFEYIDDFFGAPSIPFDMFSIPGSPGSNIPGSYTWILDLLRIGQSALWTTIGNLTRSISTLLLLLDSSFSQETLDLLNATLSGSSDIDLSKPISLESGFTGLSDLLGMFSGLESQFSSPFGSPFGDLIPDMGSTALPTGGVDMTLLENFGFWTSLDIYIEPVLRIRQQLNITLPLDFGNLTAGLETGMGGIGGIAGISGIGGIGDIGLGKSAEDGSMSAWNWTSSGLTVDSFTQTNLLEGSIAYKQVQFDTSGSIDTGNITLARELNYTIPVNQILYSIRTDNTLPTLRVAIVSVNATGHDVYAIKKHDLSDLTAGTWYNFSFNPGSDPYYEYYDPSFDTETVKGVELIITPHTSTSVNLDIDYFNLSRLILPYPYDMTILDGYLIGDGVEILPNITVRDKWTSGLLINAIQLADMSGDSVDDVIAGSNDGYIYILNGTDGMQLWNFSAGSSILDLYLEDISGDTTPEIVFGTTKGEIFVINNSQAVLWNFTTAMDLQYFLHGNLTGIGNDQLLLVNDNNITAYNYMGNQIWNRTVKGTIRSIDISDINADGLDDVGVATSKYLIYLFNGTTGADIWTPYITEERPTHLKLGNLLGDINQEIVFSTEEDYCVMLDGTQGTQIQNFTATSIIRGLYTANLTNNAYLDIILHTGLVTGQNITAFAGDLSSTLWNFNTPYGFNALSIFDVMNDNLDEVIATTIDNYVYVIDNSGVLQENFTSARSVNLIATSELTGDGDSEYIFGMGNNYLQVVNGFDFQTVWMTEEGVEIITFQFIRTNESLQLLYNLQDPITSMLDSFGFSLTGMDDLTNLASFDLGSMDTSGAGAGGMDIGGLGSIGGGGFDLSALNLTGTNFPLTGIGLVNMLEMEISVIAILQDMSLLGSSQRAYTGVHEVRHVDKDTINYQLYPLITTDVDTTYVQYKVRNFEEQPITVQNFALNLTWKGQPLPENRIVFEGWNGTHYINLGDNPVYNISMAELGLNYSNGILLFKPYIEIEELEKTLVTVDWLGREIRIRINTTGGTSNDLIIAPWVDISIEMSGITTPGVSSTIAYTKTHPTYVVQAVPTPAVPTDDDTGNAFLLMIQSPVFWALLVVGFASIMGFQYMNRREQKEVKIIATKKITNWLKKRERGWNTLVNANVMSEDQYYTLRRIRYRIWQEHLVPHPIESTFTDKILKWKLIGTFISTALMRRFWRGVNKPSRLIWIMNTLEAMMLAPLKNAYITFKTALGYMNPWDMDRQRKRDLLKKAKNKRFWKKIEPPRKPIRKKRVEIISAPSVKLKAKSPIDLPKDAKKWDDEYKTDGGALIKKISDAKKLPPFASRDGQIFYTLSQRKFVGMTLGELSKKLEYPEFEILVSLVRLFEKGLILLLQEGKTLSDDLWDIGGSLRKYDSELEKLIDSAEDLEIEIEEGIEFLQTEVKNDNNNESSTED